MEILNIAKFHSRNNINDTLDMKDINTKYKNLLEKF